MSVGGCMTYVLVSSSPPGPLVKNIYLLCVHSFICEPKCPGSSLVGFISSINSFFSDKGGAEILDLCLDGRYPLGIPSCDEKLESREEKSRIRATLGPLVRL